jgi:sulfate transport system permease protein
MMLKQRSILPGFGLSLGYTVVYLSLIVLIPLSGLFIRASSLGLQGFWDAVTSPRAVATYQVSLSTSLVAALTNAVLGSSWPGCWCAISFGASGCSTPSSICRLPCLLQWLVSR